MALPLGLGRTLVLLALLPNGLAAPAVPLASPAALGACTCDLTLGQCDANCCCDPDCQAPELAELRASFDCVPEGPPPRTDRYCYSRSWVHSVNARVELSVVADDLRDLLCVAVDNNVVEGSFFQNEARLPAERINEVVAKQSSSFHGGRQAARPSTKVRGYLAGDALKVHTAVSRADGTVQPLDGTALPQSTNIVEVVSRLPMRIADSQGACTMDPSEAVRFLGDVPSQSCWLGPVDLSTACAGELSPLNVGRWLLRRLELNENGRCGTDGTRCVAPEVRVVCSQGEAGCTSAGGNSSLPTRPAAASQFSNSGGSCTCRGAVHALAYKLYYGYDQSATALLVKRVEVAVTLQDLASPSCAAARVPQATGVAFLPDAASAPRRRSGNPGYQVGLPLLVAKCRNANAQANCLEWDGSEGSAVVPGILPSGACAAAGAAAGADRRPEIRFGEDSVFGCTLELTRQELSSLCAGQAQSFVSHLDILPFGRAGGRWTDIAAFGSIPPDAQDPGDWIPVDVSAATEVLEFSDQDPDVKDRSSASQSTCRGAVVGVDLQVVYSFFGDVRNPQAKVVAARMAHRRGSLAFTRVDPLQKQPFQFSFTVTYVQLNSDSAPAAEVPPRPELPLYLPRDIFYPFRLGSGAARRGPAAAALWAAGLAAAATASAAA